MNTEELIKTIPFSSGCEILKFDPCGLVAINKKAGHAVHPNPTSSQNGKPPMIRAKYNFRDEYYSWTDESGEKRHLYLVNRLDSPTSGVVLASTDAEVATLAKAAFKNKLVEKTYYAICIGRITCGGSWTDRLKPHNAGKFMRTRRESNGMFAKTDFMFDRIDSNNAGLSLIKLSPLTGLTHQLRVQCALHNLPILGDATYGDFAYNKKFRAVSKINRLFLHCGKTKLKIEVGGQTVEFCAESTLPESFGRTLDFNADITRGFSR